MHVGCFFIPDSLKRASSSLERLSLYSFVIFLKKKLFEEASFKPRRCLEIPHFPLEANIISQNTSRLITGPDNETLSSVDGANWKRLQDLFCIIWISYWTTSGAQHYLPLRWSISCLMLGDMRVAAIECGCVWGGDIQASLGHMTSGGSPC